MQQELVELVSREVFCLRNKSSYARQLALPGYFGPPFPKSRESAYGLDLVAKAIIAILMKGTSSVVSDL